MKIEPVYVVAPVPSGPSMPTRRALLLAAFGTAAGLAAGFTGGWVFRGAPPSERDESPPRQPEVLDPRLKHALELAKPETPMERLLAEQMLLVSVIHETHSAGTPYPQLWAPVARIAERVASDPTLSDRRLRARTLLGLLRLPHPRSLEQYSAALQEVSR